MMSIEVKNKLSEIKNIVKDRFPNQSCYFRGEPKFYETISAGLHRNRKIVLPCYDGKGAGVKAKMVGGIKFDEPQPVSVSFPINSMELVNCKVRNLEFEVDIRDPESLYEMAMIADSSIEKRSKRSSDRETDLGILQQLGYLTPYIDFTKDYLVSLFFACQDLDDEDGRVIVLGDNGSYKFHDMTQASFSIAKKRADAQKSVMLQKLELKKQRIITKNAVYPVISNLKY